MPEKYVRDWRNWIAPAAIAGTLIVALFLAFLVFLVLQSMGEKANEIDDSRAISAAETALKAIRRRMSGTLEDNAVWQEGFQAIQSERRHDWIWNNWGAASADYQLYDGVTVTDPEGRVIAAYLKGAEFDAITAFGPAFVRQVLAASSPNQAAIINTFRLNDTIVIVASRAIQPVRDMSSAERLNVLTMFKILTPGMIDAVAADFYLPGLHVVFSKPTEQLSIPLIDREGQALAYLAWPGRHLGTRIYEEVRPALMGAAIVLAILLATSVLAGYAEMMALRRFAETADREATRDLLTGLLNRSGLIRALQANLLDGSAGLTLHLIDLDGFKAVNDTWGHLVGDKLISAVADRLAACDPRLEFAARFGGDEFALASRPGADPREIAEAALQALKAPFLVAGHAAEVGASIGYAGHSGNMDAFELIRRADMALYSAKKAGRGRSIGYSPEMDRDREALASLEEQLRETLDTGGLGVVFQPVVSSATGAVAGVEALARWTSPQGPVSPDVFIPIAEKSGLIVKLFALNNSQVIEFSWAVGDFQVSFCAVFGLIVSMAARM